jgi:hypothetical protein
MKTKMREMTTPAREMRIFKVFDFFYGMLSLFLSFFSSFSKNSLYRAQRLKTPKAMKPIRYELISEMMSDWSALAI